MTKRKKFIHTGTRMGHDVMFIGHVALPLHFMIGVFIILGLAAFVGFIFVNAFKGVDPALQLTVNYGVGGVVAVVVLYWIVRGLSWVVRTTAKLNGGRVK